MTSDTHTKMKRAATMLAVSLVIALIVAACASTFTFSEIVTAEAGHVAGIDSNGRNKQSLESNPPAYAMSGLRLAAAQRELLRTSPLLLLEMWKTPARRGAGAA